MVSNLRNMAVDMGNEIESQNRQLDRINQKVSLLLLLIIFVSNPKICVRPQQVRTWEIKKMLSQDSLTRWHLLIEFHFKQKIANNKLLHFLTEHFQSGSKHKKNLVNFNFHQQFEFSLTCWFWATFPYPYTTQPADELIKQLEKQVCVNNKCVVACCPLSIVSLMYGNQLELM